MIAGATAVVAGAIVATLDVGAGVQIFGLVVMVVAAVSVGRAKAKDQTIATLQDSGNARLERIKDLEAELKGCQKRADDEHEMRRTAEKEVEGLRGELRQMERYTAKEALEQLAKQLGSIESAIVTAIQSNGEIVLRNTEILADVRRQLGDDPGPAH